MNQGVVVATLHRTFKMAVWAGVESSVKLHIERGDSLEARDEQGHTPLMLAAARNKPNICRLLINAGASSTAVDPKGRHALDFALEAKAIDAARVLGWSDVEITPPPTLDHPAAPPETLAVPEVQVLVPYIYGKSNDAVKLRLEESPITSLVSTLPVQTQATLEFVDVASEPLDKVEWISEVDAVRPEEDPKLIEGLGKTYEAISAFKPIDSSADWSDLDVFLPERSTPLAKADDPEARAKLRLLLLRAMREGSIPALSIDDLTHDPDETKSAATEALITRIIGDLGGETDERIEYQSTLGDFTVHVDPKESAEEEDILSDAIDLYDSVSSRRNDLLYLYFRETQSIDLIDAKREAALGRSMEIAYKDAMEVISTNPALVAELLKVGLELKEGRTSLSLILTGLLLPADSIIGAPTTTAEFEDSDDDVESESQTPQERIDEALLLFANIQNIAADLESARNIYGLDSPIHVELQGTLTAACQILRLADAVIERVTQPLEIIFTEIHRCETALYTILVKQCGYPPQEFIASFIDTGPCTSAKSATPCDVQWAVTESSNELPWTEGLKPYVGAIVELQKELANLESEVGLPLHVLKFQRDRLINAATEIQQAKHKLATANLRLVISIAQRFRRSGVPFEDLIKEGNIGLFKSVDKFDYRRGYKFSTYATWWIRQAVSRYVADESRIVRVPVHAHETAQRLMRAYEAFEGATGRLPTMIDLAESEDVQVGKVRSLMRSTFETIPITELAEVGLIPTESMGDYLVPDPFIAAFEHEFSRNLEHMLDQLEVNQARVIRMRFGLFGLEELTLDDIGQQLECWRRPKTDPLEAIVPLQN
jgi:RNA polymerase sigma factor (sigma-70 family)